MEFDDEKRKIAIHESTHAVMIYIEGGKLCKATITGPLKNNVSDNERTPYYVTYSLSGVEKLFRLTAEDFLSRLKINLAPYIVENKLFGRPLGGSILDIVDAIKFLAPAYKEPEMNSLVENARRVIDQNKDDWESAAIQFVDECGKPVQDLLEDQNIIDAIKALSEYLLARKQ